MAKRWYVAHTYSGHEYKAKKYLESAIEAGELQDKFGQILSMGPKDGWSGFWHCFPGRVSLSLI